MPHDPSALVASTTIARSDDQLSCQVDNEAVLMNLKSGQYFGCDPIGSRVWALIEQPIAISVLCERLVAEFPDVTLDDCLKDVLPFLGELVDEGLITASPGATST